MSEHGVRFPPGSVVSPGMYRNSRTGATRWFDGSTALPGGPNASAWKQVSDHQHVESQTASVLDQHGSRRDHGVRFGPGTVVSPGMYRNVHTGAMRWFDGSTALPGGANASAWKQVSDHQHTEMEGTSALDQHGSLRQHGVRFNPGTVVSPGMYRNTRTGAVRWFDGDTALPGSPNSSPWQQVSDHYHAPAETAH